MIQRSKFLRGLCASPALFAVAGAAQADQLDDVRAAKKIRIAIDPGAPPLGTTGKLTESSKHFRG